MVTCEGRDGSCVCVYKFGSTGCILPRELTVEMVLGNKLMANKNDNYDLKLCIVVV